MPLTKQQAWTVLELATEQREAFHKTSTPTYQLACEVFSGKPLENKFFK